MILYLRNLNKPYICVFDIEHDRGKLIQFAGILFKRVGANLYQVCRSINSYVKQGQLSNFISNFAHLDKDFMDKWGITQSEMIETFCKFVKGIPENDILFISHGVFQDSLVLKDNGIDLSMYETLCTYQLAKSVLKRTNHLTVGDIAAECGCSIISAHNAYGDAFTTACILSFLLKRQGDKENEEIKSE